MIRYLIIGILLYLLFQCWTNPSYANSIYIIQSGSNLDLDVTQDGQNNEIEASNGSAIVYALTVQYLVKHNGNQIRAKRLFIGKSIQAIKR